MKKLSLLFLLVMLLLTTGGVCAYADTLTLPADLTAVGEAAFQNDTSLSAVIIPEGINELPPLLFAGSSVSEIHLPSTLRTIAETAFQGCRDTRFYVKTREAYEWAEDHGFSAEYEDYHIGVITGSPAQSEDESRGAATFRTMVGADRVKLAYYPDNFAQNTDGTVQIIAAMAEDPKMRAIVVNQAVPGTAEGFRQVKQIRPDILCIACEAHEDLTEIGAAADLVCSNDFIARGYLLVHTAHELGCDTFVHISFPRHMSYATMSRRASIMKAACEAFGMSFVLETAPDPVSAVGIAGAQAYITEYVPRWIDEYGTNAAFFCTNDGHVEPLIRQLLQYGGYFIEADLPSPSLGYPGALGVDLSAEGGDYARILARVEQAVVDQGGAGRFGTWAYSYGATMSAGLARHAMNVIDGESALTDMEDIAEACAVFSPGAGWNGSNYKDLQSGDTYSNVILVYEDTYIMGDPGFYMGCTELDIPSEYFNIS